MSIPFSITMDSKGKVATALIEGQMLVATDEHPNFDTICKHLVDGVATVDDFDVRAGVSTRFASVTDRVTISGNQVFFDGDPMNNTIARKIIDFYSNAVDFLPLVSFMERLASNPNEHSREQLFDWLEADEWQITDTGMIVGYKGVDYASTPREGYGNRYQSCSTGTANVAQGYEEEFEQITGAIPNDIGYVVTMPRSKVAHLPSEACSTGLHVGTWGYAKDFGPVTLKVLVDPRDVVSVPTDCHAQKMRVCRYEVVEVVEERSADLYEGLAKWDDDDEPDEVYDWLDEYDDDESDEVYDWLDEDDDDFYDDEEDDVLRVVKIFADLLGSWNVIDQSTTDFLNGVKDR